MRPEHTAMAACDRAAVKARQGEELIPRGDLRVVDDNGNEVPQDGATLGEIVVRAQIVVQRHDKAPHTVTFIAELPKTATGKIQKFVLRGGRAAIARQ